MLPVRGPERPGRPVHVPFKGEASAIQALMGGQIKAVMGAQGSLAVQAKAGTMKLLALALPTRLKEFPEVPTFAEAGYPAVKLSGWSMGIVPDGTPSRSSTRHPPRSRANRGAWARCAKCARPARSTNRP